MKTNKMPKRIYLFDYNDAMVTPLEGDTVYVREDAFIEKACEWLENHNDYIDVKDGNITYFDMEKCVEDFKNYMKGGEK